MIKSLMSMGRAASAQALRIRKDNILSNLTNMISQLRDLQEAQDIAMLDVEENIAKLTVERNSIAEMQESTARTLKKITDLVE